MSHDEKSKVKKDSVTLKISDEEKKITLGFAVATSEFFSILLLNSFIHTMYEIEFENHLQVL